MASAISTSDECSLDNELQVLLTLLFLLAAVGQLNSTFYYATSVYMCRRQAINGMICNYANMCSVNTLLSAHIGMFMPSEHEWSCQMCFKECLYGWRLFLIWS